MMKNKENQKTIEELQQQLSELKEKHDFLVENNVDVLWTMDLKMNFTYVNKTLTKVLGYAPEEWLGKNLRKYTTEEDFGTMWKIATDTIKNALQQKPVVFEATILHKDGTPIDFEIHAKVVIKHGIPIGLQGISRDITVRKQQEQVLKKNLEELEKLNSMTIDREMKMVELKRRVVELEEELEECKKNNT